MPVKKYSKDLMQRLHNKSYASLYLKSALGQNDNSSFLLALRNVIDANGGIGEISKKSNISRQHLYKILKEDGNPTLSTLNTILNSIGLSLDFTPEKEAA